MELNGFLNVTIPISAVNKLISISFLFIVETRDCISFCSYEGQVERINLSALGRSYFFKRKCPSRSTRDGIDPRREMNRCVQITRILPSCRGCSRSLGLSLSFSLSSFLCLSIQPSRRDDDSSGKKSDRSSDRPCTSLKQLRP